MSRSLKRDIQSMNRGMSSHQRSTGENVLWFEYNPQDSTKHPIYDEGPSRMWYRPFMLPVMFLNYHQNDPTRTDDGLYIVSSASFTFQIFNNVERFKISPLDTAKHFKDRFAYNNPPFFPLLFNVTDYEKQGFVNGTYLTVSVRGEQVKSEELVNDVQNQDFFFQEQVQ